MTNPSQPEEKKSLPKVEISFISYQNAFKTGEYTVTVDQNIKINGQEPPNSFNSQINFVVSGERFYLNPQDIHAVFPPANNLGIYVNVFPYIVLKRSTLPWEREPQKEKRQTNFPWLFLLLFDEEELQVDPKSGKLPPVLPLQRVPLKELTEEAKNKLLTLENIKNNDLETLPTEILSLKDLSVNINFPKIKLESWEEPQEKKDPELVTVVDVQKQLLEKLLPFTLNELSYLTHVRQVKVDQQEEQLAVVLGNRLVKQGGFSTACLVSLEGRYAQIDQFDYQEASDQDYIRLVVLKSWSFASLKKERSFQGLLKNLDVDTLRLSADTTSNLGKYLAAGYVPLPHFVREGSKTISWYRSPLSPVKKESEPEVASKNIHVADDLIQVNSNRDLLDISYAAAWQLGRLLALQDRKFALELYHWKREQVQRRAKTFQENQNFHLFSLNQAVANSSENSQGVEYPSGVNERLKELELLRGVPFNYLVPDERMLPSESIRFFYLDWFWIKCLQDGALSIGSGTNPCQKKVVTGFLLRSEVVSGWPDLDFNVSDRIVSDLKEPLLAQTPGLTPLRIERMSENVLLCLFAGEIHTVEAYLKTAALHFGTLKPEWRDQELRLVNFNKADVSSAQLAKDLIQKSERVRFNQKPS